MTIPASSSSLWPGGQPNYFLASSAETLFIDVHCLMCLWFCSFLCDGRASRWQATNERRCLLLPPTGPSSALWSCPSGDPQTAPRNLRRGRPPSLNLVPAEALISLRWLSHQAHATCYADVHLGPADRTGVHTQHDAAFGWWCLSLSLYVPT